MVKMKERNGQLKSSLGAMAPKERVVAANYIPKENTTNRQGYKAYSLDDELRLLSMLNTLKLEPQFYRSENQTMRELRDLIERIALKDPYFVAQAIVYSRCVGEGMRSINHLAAALLAPFISGKEYAKRFYGLWDKKNQRGGCIFRVDDMSEIKDVYSALNKSTLSNSMKKGFNFFLFHNITISNNSCCYLIDSKSFSNALKICLFIDYYPFLHMLPAPKSIPAAEPYIQPLTDLYFLIFVSSLLVLFSHHQSLSMSL